MSWILVLNTWSRWGLFQNISRFTIEVQSLGMETVSFQGFTQHMFFKKKETVNLGEDFQNSGHKPLKSLYVSIIKTFIPPKFDDLLQKRHLESQDDLYWEDIEHVWRHLDFFFF